MSISFCELGISRFGASAAARATPVLSPRSLCGATAAAKGAGGVCCARHARHASTLAVASPAVFAVSLPATLVPCPTSICVPAPAPLRASTCDRAPASVILGAGADTGSARARFGFALALLMNCPQLVASSGCGWRSQETDEHAGWSFFGCRDCVSAAGGRGATALNTLVGGGVGNA